MHSDLIRKNVVWFCFQQLICIEGINQTKSQETTKSLCVGGTQLIHRAKQRLFSNLMSDTSTLYHDAA